jgi:hypothetical protein
MTTPGTTTTTSTSIRARRPSQTFRRQELLLVLPPAALLAVWLGLLLASFGATVDVIYANADIVSAPVIGELFPKAPSATVTTLGFLPWYSTLWFELATRWVPFHRVLWEVGPWLASIAGILAVAWSTAKASSRWAAWLVAVVLVCAGNTLLPIQFASDLHGATLVCVCALDAFLVLLVLRAGRIGSTWAHVCLCVLVAALAAAGLASDDLLYPAGFVPFLVAGLAQLWWQPGAAGRRIAISTAAIAALAVVGSRIAVAAMHDHRAYAAQYQLTYAGWTDLVPHAAQLVQSLVQLFSGDFGGAQIGARSVLAFACALVVVGGGALAWREGRAQLRRVHDRAAAHATREAHITFWFLALVLPVVAFVLSSQGGAGKGRYLASSGYGIVVLAALVLSGKRAAVRAVGVAAACIVVTGSLLALEARDLEHQSVFPTRAFARGLEAFVDGEGLKYGYAAYWDAAPLTWDLHERVQIFPVEACDAPHGLCRPAAHYIESWYEPRPSTRTFLLVDRIFGPPAPATRLGGPAEVVSIDRYTIYVYDYDIGAAMGPPAPVG